MPRRYIHRLDLVGDDSAILQYLSVLTEIHQKLTVNHIDGGVFFGGIRVIVLRRPDVNVLFIAMTCERDLVELGGVVNFLPFGVGKKIVICLVPAADAGIERKMMCFIIIGGDVRHIVQSAVTFAGEGNGAAVLADFFHFNVFTFSVDAVKKGCCRL